MAIYYFSEDSEPTELTDEEGIEFDTVHAACNAAEIALREIAAHSPPSETSFSLTVFDSSFAVVRRIMLETRAVA